MDVNAMNIIQSGLNNAANVQTAQFKLDFSKISYDYILTKNAQEYCDSHPGTSLDGAIDIIRDAADQEYLDEISKSCGQN